MKPFRRKFVAAIVASVALCPAAHARKDALVVGGGCETGDLLKERICEPDSVNPCDEKIKGHYNAWRKTMQLAQRTLFENGWNVNVLYDSSEWARPSYWPAPTPPGPGAGTFTKAKFIQALLAEANSPHQPGDEFFMDISTHGSAGPDHEICLGDGTLMPISELKPYLALIKQKGVKVALLDESCYSGNTALQLADLGVCAMSATSADQTSWIAYSPAQSFYATGNSKSQPIRYSGEDLMVPRKGTPDTSVDGRISASEAFAFARINMPDQVLSQNGANRLPLSSDCLLAEQHLQDKLRGAAPFLDGRDWEPGENLPDVLANADRGESHGPKVGYKARMQQVQCIVQDMTQAFGSVLAGMKGAAYIRLVNELRTMGYDGPIDQLPAQVNSDFAEILRTVEDDRKAQKEMKKYIAAGQPIPKAVLDPINNSDERITQLQTRIRSNVGLLMHMACGAEKLRSQEERAHACENFDMWHARIGE